MSTRMFLSPISLNAGYNLHGKTLKMKIERQTTSDKNANFMYLVLICAEVLSDLPLHKKLNENNF